MARNEVEAAPAVLQHHARLRGEHATAEMMVERVDKRHRVARTVDYRNGGGIGFARGGFPEFPGRPLPIDHGCKLHGISIAGEAPVIDIVVIRISDQTVTLAIRQPRGFEQHVEALRVEMICRRQMLENAQQKQGRRTLIVGRKLKDLKALIVDA